MPPSAPPMADRKPPADPAHARPAALHLHEPVAAGAALPRPDRRAGRLRLSSSGSSSSHLVEAAMGSEDGDRHHPAKRRRAGRRRLRDQVARDAHDAGRAGPDRRRDDLEPADHGHRRRLRDVRVADAARGSSGPARVAVARERVGAEGEARHRDHRHLVDPPAEDLHQRGGLRREGAALPDGDPHHVPAVGARDRGRRPHHAAGPAAPGRSARHGLPGAQSPQGRPGDRPERRDAVDIRPGPP